VPQSGPCCFIYIGGLIFTMFKNQTKSIPQRMHHPCAHQLLTWKIFIVFQVDWWADFTPSLLHFLLDIWKLGGALHMKLHGMLVGKLEIPMRDLCGSHCLSSMIPLKDAT